MKIKIYADHINPIVQAQAIELTKNAKSIEERLQKIFLYVRDGIKFGFPSSGDLTTASETIKLKLGQCNTKGTLFLALCRAIGIPARIHYSTVDKEIQYGIFPLWANKRVKNLRSDPGSYCGVTECCSH